MKKTLFALIFLLLISAMLSAQPSKNADEKNAADVPDKLFEAMRMKNADAIRALFNAEGQLVAIDKPRSGEGLSKTRVLSGDAFAKLISEAKGAEFVEKMPNKEVEINGDLATVSGRYTFYLGEKFSHCGTNTFNLVRAESSWKIANAASTLEFQCENDIKAIEIPSIEANPQDISTIDGIIKAFYEVISGGKGVRRQWSRDKTLYAPEVRFVALSAENAKIRADVMNHYRYANGSNEFFVKEGFTEREINRVVRRFGIWRTFFRLTSGSLKTKNCLDAASTASIFSGTERAGGLPP